nr:hypothetical protein [Tanacetum cinerariifolium]
MDQVSVHMVAASKVPMLKPGSEKLQEVKIPSTKRTVLVEIPASAALVSCNGLGGHDWSDQAEDGPTNFALSAYSSTISNSKGNPQMNLQDKGVIDKGCSRNMIESMSYLTDYEEIDGGYVAFGGKFDGNADEGFFVGYSLNSKAFRVFNNRTRIVKENLHIRFSENTPNIAESGPNWLFDIDALTKSMNYKPVLAGNQSNRNAGTKACNYVGKVRMETVLGKDYILLPLWTADPLISQESKSSQNDGFQPSSNDGKKIDEDPRQETECNDQEKEDDVNSTNNVNTVGTNGVNVVGANTNNEIPFDPEMPALEDISTFNFSSDHDDDDEMAYMNNLDTTIQNLEEHGFVTTLHQRINHKDLQKCLFACFLSQEEPKKVIHALKDPSWIEAMQEELLQFKLQEVWTFVDLPYEKRAIGTKWVFWNKKDERGIVIRNKARLVDQGHTQEEGIDYDEVFAPVSRIKAIRLFLAYASFKDFVVYQMDVKCAFLYKKIKEEALYGLHQAPRAWYEILLTYLLDNGFHIIFIRRVGKGFSRRETPLFPTMMVQAQEYMGEGSVNPINPHHTPTIIQPSTSQQKKTKQHKKPRRKVTQVPQPSGPTKHVADEAVNEEMDDSLEKAATTATSLDAEQDRGNIFKTQSKATPNELGSQGTSSGGGPRCQETIGDTVAQTRSERVKAKYGLTRPEGDYEKVLWVDLKVMFDPYVEDEHKKPRRKVTQVPQPSGPTEHVEDEAVNEEMDDSLEKAATTATSLDAEQDRGNIFKTQSKATPNELGSRGTSSGGGPRCQETIGDTVAQTRSERVKAKYGLTRLEGDYERVLWVDLKVMFDPYVEDKVWKMH